MLLKTGERKKKVEMEVKGTQASCDLDWPANVPKRVSPLALLPSSEEASLMGILCSCFESCSSGENEMVKLHCLVPE